MHHVRVRYVAVGEHDLIYAVTPAYAFELRFLHDRDARWIALSGKRRRVASPGDVGDLCRGECDTSTPGASRYTTLKLWKSRPAAPMITTHATSRSEPMIARGVLNETPRRSGRYARKSA
jgi:hypothetical protein